MITWDTVREIALRLPGVGDQYLLVNEIGGFHTK
jgi:hypothetical protein